MQDYFVFARKLVLIFAFRVHGKPTFADAFALLEDFADTPERRESKDAQEDRKVRVLHEQRAACRE